MSSLNIQATTKSMKNYRKIFIFLYIIPGIVMADINLVCKGSLENSVDLKPRGNEKSILDIKINEDLKTVIVKGNWGCPLLAVSDNDKSFPCFEIPVKFSDDEILSSRFFSGNKITGSYTFTLNRNSGSLKTSSIQNTTSEALGYKWFTYMISGQFECVVAQRKF